MKPEPEAIFAYQDHRAFLSDTFRAAKLKSKRISHRWVAMRAGFASSGFFSRILSGQVKMGPRTVSGLLRLMELKGLEADYFKAMVDYNQSNDLAMKQNALHSMHRCRSGGGTHLQPDQSEFWSDYKYAMIRDALWVEPFDGNAEAFGKRFSPPLLAAEVKHVIEKLLHWGLTEVDDAGLVRRSDVRSLTSGLKSREEAIAAYQHSYLELAHFALDTTPESERNFSTLSFSIPSSRWPEIEIEIRRFRRALRSLAEDCLKEDRLMQMNVQVFPVFRST